MTKSGDITTRHGIEQIRKRLRAEAESISSGRNYRPSLDRRTFLLGSLATGLGWTRMSSAQGTAAPGASPMATPVANVALAENPFTLGIASGEPVPDGMVLWTRLAPQPFEPNGGMPGASVELAYEIANDERFTDIVQQGPVIADAAWAHSVHLEVSGLQPDRWYWYRFRIGEFDSPAGRTRTAPAPGAPFEEFRFAFASCQRWEDGLFTAFRDMAQQDVDLVIHLGDYIYEYLVRSNAQLRDIEVPTTALSEIRTLDDYRMRYALYKLDPHLQEAHRVAPWLVTWDDHEVSNNYIVPIIADDPFAKPLIERREAAYRAYYEHQPLRASARPKGPNLKLYRAAEFGDLVRFNVLDERQYRTPGTGVCGAGEREEFEGFCASAVDPDQTMLGEQQKQWLLDGFTQTTTRWSVLAQQVPMARIDYDPSATGKSFGGEDLDKWDGYAYERDQVLAAMADAAKAQSFSPVVVTGDVHANFVWNLKRDWDAPEGESIIGTEFVGTSIASNGDDPLKDDGEFSTRCGNLRGNSHNLLFDNHRGYVLCELTPDQWHTTYRVMPTVEDPDATASTLTSFVVEHDQPGAQMDGTCHAGGPA
jgi:alkaline phosphatase D